MRSRSRRPPVCIGGGAGRPADASRLRRHGGKRTPLRFLFSFFLAGMMAALGPSPVAAQGLGLGASVHAGTLGLGAQISAPLFGSPLRLRAGFGYQPMDIEVRLSDVTYGIDLPSPSLTALLDWHPGDGSFRVSGGAVHYSSGLELSATPTASVQIGTQAYEPAEIGSLVGGLATSESGPYAGIGWGHGGGRRLGLSLDLGVVYHGVPEVTLRATGPIADAPAFRSQLELEIDEVSDLVSIARVYPVLNLGIVVGL